MPDSACQTASKRRFCCAVGCGRKRLKCCMQACASSRRAFIIKAQALSTTSCGVFNCRLAGKCVCQSSRRGRLRSANSQFGLRLVM
ncbi:hypothetical protein D3C84_1011640 [compost metagenome]